MYFLALIIIKKINTKPLNAPLFHFYRKEHLMAILKIKGGIKHEEKIKLLYYVKNRKILFGENRLKFFEDVNTEGFHLKDLLCCQCCCA